MTSDYEARIADLQRELEAARHVRQLADAALAQAEADLATEREARQRAEGERDVLLTRLTEEAQRGLKNGQRRIEAETRLADALGLLREAGEYIRRDHVDAQYGVIGHPDNCHGCSILARIDASGEATAL